MGASPSSLVSLIFEESELRLYLAGAGYSAEHINKTLVMLRSAVNAPNQSLMAVNKAVYQLLRYGVSVKVAAGANAEMVQLINWGQPEENRFAVAEYGSVPAQVALVPARVGPVAPEGRMLGGSEQIWRTIPSR
ncbi:type I restriction endonuclease [Candidatus Sororendozoicomonas aggregata]|uniref:type I restriction endonuclease n=1 Tax=Candidatus Sororendozoicomonas aggregata TaxID=3073239 RepID=UPI002ED06C9B